MMKEETVISSEPIRVAGHEIQVTVSLDTFWCIEGAACRARDALRGNLDVENELEWVMKVAGSIYAEGRRDDPTLPAHYRRYLQP
jgi:hypothetical protein